MQSRLLGAIKSALFEDGAEKTEADGDAHARSAAAGGVPAAANGDSAASAEWVTRLTELVMSQPSKYTRLLQAASRLERFIPEEAARIKGALSVEDDFTAKDVLAAIDSIHLAELDQQIAAFKAQSAGRMKKEVDQRMKAVESKKGQVEARAQEAERLRQELAAKLDEMARLDLADNTQIAETLCEVDAQRAEIEQVNARFQAASEQVRHNLLQMREKLARHLAP